MSCGWPLVGWFAAGAVPFAVAGALLLAHAPLGPLKRLLGVFLIAVVLWRRLPTRLGPSRPGVRRGRCRRPGSVRRCWAPSAR